MKGLGYRLDVPDDVLHDLRYRDIDGLLGVGSPMATSRDWRHLDNVVLDQGPTNTCVAQSGSTALYMRGQAAGVPIPRPSILHGYVYGQLEDQRLEGVAVDDRKVMDIGMRARSMFLAWSQYGVVSEERWGFDPAELARLVAASSIRAVSERIPFDVDMAGADAMLEGWYPIDPRRKSLDIARALDKAHFPVIAIRVFENFLGWTGMRDYDAPEGEWIGNHMMTCVGFRPGYTLLKNSWGKGWGDEGYVWLSNVFIDGLHGLDGWVVTAAPNVR